MPHESAPRWHSCLARLGGDHRVGHDAWADLETRYTEPHRRYHDLAHATAVAHDAEQLAADLPVHERAVVVLAAWATWSTTPYRAKTSSAARSGFAAGSRAQGLPTHTSIEPKPLSSPPPPTKPLKAT